jgi:hypothetical protein
MHAKSITLPGADVGQIAVPTKARHLRKVKARFIASLIEETELHTLGGLREKRKISAGTVVGGAQRIVIAGPNFGHFTDASIGTTRDSFRERQRN